MLIYVLENYTDASGTYTPGQTVNVAESYARVAIGKGQAQLAELSPFPSPSATQTTGTGSMAQNPGTSYPAVLSTDSTGNANGLLGQVAGTPGTVIPIGALSLRQNILRMAPFPIGGNATVPASKTYAMIYRSPVPFSALRIWTTSLYNGAAAYTLYNGISSPAGTPAYWYQSCPINVSTPMPVWNGSTNSPFPYSYPSGVTNLRTNDTNTPISFTANSGADYQYLVNANGSAGTLSVTAPSNTTSRKNLNWIASDWLSCGSSTTSNAVGGAYQSADGFYYFAIFASAGAPCYVPNNAGDVKAFINSSLVTGSSMATIVDCYTSSNSIAAFTTWNPDITTGTVGQLSVMPTPINSWPAVCVELLTTARVTNVCVLADSQLQGNNVDNNSAITSSDLGAIQRACLALNTVSRPIGFTSLAYPGREFEQWIGTHAPGLNNLETGYGTITSNQTGTAPGAPIPATVLPDVLFLPWASANDNTSVVSTLRNASGSSNPTINSQIDHFYKTINIINWGKKNGMLVVPCTVPPASGRYTTTLTNWQSVEGARNYYNNALRNMAASNSNFLLLDTDAIVSGGGSPAVISSQYAQSDGLHFNDAGNAAVAAAAKAILLKILASS